MIKKLLFTLAALLVPTLAQAFVPVRYVQISTNTITRQLGGFNVQSGSATAIQGSTITYSSATFSNLNVPGPATLGAAGSAVTISSNTIMPGATHYQNGPLLMSTSIQFSPSTIGIFGTQTNNDALGGYVGELKSSSTGGNFVSMPTSAQWGDMASVLLTAGDWDISGLIIYGNNGATTTLATLVAGISSTAGNNGAGLLDGDNKCSIDTALLSTSSNFSSCTIPPWRVSISATTTYYLKSNEAYSVATPTVAGRISARRVR